MSNAWLKIFRVVNLPTVPGDVLAGVAVSGVAGFGEIAVAGAAAVLFYMFGLLDNDIVGVRTDKNRPLASGEVSLAAARILRGGLLFAALVLASAFRLPSLWWITAFALTVAIVVYNRTKLPAAMGLCRGLNVACGAALAGVSFSAPAAWTMAAWTLYVAAVTKYSEGEEHDEGKRRRVGALIGAIVYLQLLALLLAYCAGPTETTRNLLLGGALLLLLLRVCKRIFKEVGAS